MNTSLIPQSRQERFAYLYAKGLSAQQAARRAGFSRATAETNAHRIPKGRKMAKLIQVYRQALGALELEAMPALVAKAMHSLRNTDNPSRLIELAKCITTLAQMEKSQFQAFMTGLQPQAGSSAKGRRRQDNTDKANSDNVKKIKRLSSITLPPIQAL